ncbi:MAG: response regulator [Ignavibacteriales bacterium]|nr:Polar-differentiation response regulator DivK [Ignavibacteriaceae bacterium]MCK6615754.1 response regulator [Ignavibacteriaceae bacterium]QOJ30094.1 MAG: response regulator [Ignavibacteriales bacterium]
MNRKIVIIEDNEQNMYMLTYLLESNSYEVHQCYSGAEGIVLAGEVIPAAILLDIQLPEMDGHAVARKLRENTKLDKVPIIAVTSYAMVGDREKVMESGADGYIEKPIDPDTFIIQMEAIISEKAKK